MATAKKTIQKKAAAKKVVAKKAAAKKTVTKKTATKKVAKKTATKKPTKKASVSAKSKTKHGAKIDSVSIRMYCHGFGDCFLLSFLSDNEPVFRMLIDCGMLTGNTDTLAQAIEDIKTTCDNKLDVVVQTHEHKDHISGFNLKDKKTKKLLWDDIEVGQVWLAWTENAGRNGDTLAKQLKKKQDQKKQALANALGLYRTQIASAQHRNAVLNEYHGVDYYDAQMRYAQALEQMLAFYDIQLTGNAAAAGELGLTMKEAMSYFIKRNEKDSSPDIYFWDPGDFADTETTGMNGVNFYFLGPPKDYNKLKIMDDTTHTEMYASDMGLSDNFFTALTERSDDPDCSLSPFNKKYFYCNDPVKGDITDTRNVYNDPKNSYRTIETDWLHNAGALALNLDSYTNNTSLVIAIEFEESEKVLLFAADAQIGNWLSWTEPVSEKDASPKLHWQKKITGGKKKTVTAEDLLSRTIFYKVGHHASHNATARKHGLEMMTSKDLVAIIPVDEVVAKKQGKKGWEMPAADLYDRLQQKTRGRIIRADKGNLIKKDTKALAQDAKPSKEQQKTFNNHITESDTIITTDDGAKRPLYIEYLVKK